MSEGVFTFRVEQTENGSLVASLHREDGNQTMISPGGYYNRYRHRYHHFERVQDDVGALYYVVAVILIYGCSILMMIASYIRKNKVSSITNLRFTYLLTYLLTSSCRSSSLVVIEPRYYYRRSSSCSSEVLNLLLVLVFSFSCSLHLSHSYPVSLKRRFATIDGLSVSGIAKKNNGCECYKLFANGKQN